VVAAGVIGRRLRRTKDERADGDGDTDGADGTEAPVVPDQDREDSDHALSV